MEAHIARPIQARVSLRSSVVVQKRHERADERASIDSQDGKCGLKKGSLSWCAAIGTTAIVKRCPSISLMVLSRVKGKGRYPIIGLKCIFASHSERS